MLDHIILTVSDLDRSVDFYTSILETLGITMSMDFKGQNGHPDLKGFGDGRTVFFWLKKGVANANGVHIGFIANNHDEVKVFHRAAVAAHAKIIFEPRVFPEYYPGYFATWISDPDGYEIELVNKS